MGSTVYVNHFVIGTAGHVDHGKSTLVKALTGIDPDRLAEEKARAMTIDLGFAWLTLPSGREVSVVDVPGHEHFIKNMLAGVGGVDLALLIVAADEGPMPQTIEHLAILDLLQIPRGVIVLTKADTVEPDWLDLVREETRERVAGTVLDGAPIVATSALTGEGFAELKSTIDRILDEVGPRPGGQRPRLPIDRVFTVAGFGTVVTGTLTGGELALGQELRIAPRGQTVRVRGLQSHKAKVARAQPGSRVAVNLGGVAVDDLQRGDVLAPAGLLTPSQRVDVYLRMLEIAPVVVEQNTQVDFFTGASELPARLTLLDRERLGPGERGWVQVRFREPLAVLKGDRFIIRRASPSITIGGGEIIDPAPSRHRRFRPEVLDALETLAAGSPDEIVLQALEEGPREVRTLRRGALAGLTDAQIDEALGQLIAEGDVRVLGPTRTSEEGHALRPTGFVISATAWSGLLDRTMACLTEFHKAQPLRRGMPKEELRSRLRLGGPSRLFDEVIATGAEDGVIADDGQTVRSVDHHIVLDPARRGLADRYLEALRAEPATPPAPLEFGLDVDTLGALVDLNEVVRVADGVVYAPESYAAIEREVLALLDRDGVVTLAGFRDHFKTSRKYAQATLEYLDQRRITRRVGDERVRCSGGAVADV